MRNKPIFDDLAGDSAKESGISRAALSKKAELQRARDAAERIAMKDPNRECHIDLVQAVMYDDGIDLGFAAGSVFREKDKWEFVRFKKSSIVANHRRPVSVWKLKL